MKKSFIISNADASFDAYYQSQIKKKEKKMGIQEPMTSTQTGEENHFGLVEGIMPAARDGHCAVKDSQGCMYVFGGDRHLMPFNDLYMIKLQWTPLEGQPVWKWQGSSSSAKASERKQWTENKTKQEIDY